MDPTPSGRSLSVSDDWRRWLAGRKNEAFRACRTELESSYVMLSVALNEAIEFMHCGCFRKARQAACNTPQLCERLAVSLTAVLRPMGEHARCYGTVPNAVPLDASNFRGVREQRVARMSRLLSHVLLTQRSQVLYKLSTLEDMVGALQRDFCAHAEELLFRQAGDTAALWSSLDDNHFDLNTCLQETIVLLKSFFVVLPEKHVVIFETSVHSFRDGSLASPKRLPAVRAGRAAQLAGQ